MLSIHTFRYKCLVDPPPTKRIKPLVQQTSETPDVRPVIARYVKLEAVSFYDSSSAVSFVDVDIRKRRERYPVMSLSY